MHIRKRTTCRVCGSGALKKVIEAALKELNQHRTDEGLSLEKELQLRIKNINDQEEEILKLEPKRKEKMKKRGKKPIDLFKAAKSTGDLIKAANIKLE